MYKQLDTFAGMGQISKTLNRAQVMQLSASQWLGEEGPLEDMPMIYDAIANSETVTTFRIPVANFLELNLDDQQLISVKMWQKLKFINERV